MSGKINQLYDQDETSCYNKTTQSSCSQVVDTIQVNKSGDNYSTRDAIVKLILQNVTHCTDKWVNINIANSTNVDKCNLEADFSVSNGV